MKCNLLAIVLILFVLPGCGRVVDWARSNFYQGEKINQFSYVPRKYIRSVIVYDQLDTEGIFDALWLSDLVRTAYADSYAQSYGKTKEQKFAFLRRQLEENKHFISFYLLSRYDHKLTDANPQWTVSMRIDNDIFLPIDLKIIDLNQQYQSFFGDYFNRFKNAYLIKFDAKDIEGNPLLTPKTKQLALIFRTIGKEVALEWHFDLNNNLIPDKIVKKQRMKEEREQKRLERREKKKKGKTA